MEQFWALVAYVQDLETNNVTLAEKVRRLEAENLGLRAVRDQVIQDSLNPKRILDLCAALRDPLG
jgi:hypothetical protein